MAKTRNLKEALEKEKGVQQAAAKASFDPGKVKLEKSKAAKEDLSRKATAKQGEDKGSRAKDEIVKDINAKAKAEKERTEKGKHAKEKADKIAKERAVNEKIAKERAEKAKIAKERAEKEILAKEKFLKDRAEKERIAKEKFEKERAEKARLAKEKFEKERAEKERIAKEKAELKKIAKEKAKGEKEPLKLSKPRTRLAKSRPIVEDSSRDRVMEGEADLGMALIVRETTEGGDFDEEREERDDFHTAKLAQEFAKEEEHIRHDEVPDSDDERESWAESDRENPQFHRSKGSMYKGQSFYNGIAFKESVTDYCLSTGYNLRQYRHDRDKISFRCVGSATCKFQVYVSSLPADPTWRIRIFKDQHDCIPNGHCDMFKVPVIARLFVDKIREEPDYYMPKKIEELVVEQWRIVVTRH